MAKLKVPHWKESGGSWQCLQSTHTGECLWVYLQSAKQSNGASQASREVDIAFKNLCCPLKQHSRSKRPLSTHTCKSKGTSKLMNFPKNEDRPSQLQRSTKTLLLLVSFHGLSLGTMLCSTHSHPFLSGRRLVHESRVARWFLQWDHIIFKDSLESGGKAGSVFKARILMNVCGRTCKVPNNQTGRPRPAEKWTLLSKTFAALWSSIQEANVHFPLKHARAKALRNWWTFPKMRTDHLNFRDPPKPLFC